MPSPIATMCRKLSQVWTTRWARYCSSASENVRWQVLLPLAASILLLQGVFVINTYRTEDAEIARAAQADADELRREIEEEIEDKGQQLELLTRQFLEVAPLRQAIEHQDRQFLADWSKRPFAHLAEQNITHLYFINADRQIIYRSHRPEQHGDQIERPVLLRAANTGRQMQGVEVGVNGNFTLRVVTPCFQDQKLVGFLELGMEFHCIMAEARERLQADIAILMRKEFLQERPIKAVLARDGRLADWDIHEHFLNLDPQIDIPAQVAAALSGPAAQMRVLPGTIHRGGRRYQAYATPVFDSLGRPIAQAVAQMDVTDRLASAANRTLFVVISTAAIGLALFAFFFVFMTRLQKRLRQNRLDLVKHEQLTTLGQLSAGVAHEINTPTGAILNVSADMKTHLLSLLEARRLGEHFTAQEQQALDAMVAQAISHDSHASEAASRSRRRDLERELRQAGLADSRRVATLLVNAGMDDKLDPQAYALLGKPGVLAMLESVQALAVAAKICTTSAHKVARIVKALKCYGRDSQDATSSVDVVESVDSALVILQNRIKHIATVDTDYRVAACSVQCSGDISQVWTNILNNACDAVEAAARPGELGRIAVGVRTEGRQAVISISNTGLPIPEHVLGQMFNPFYTTKPVGKGTGLGLSICQGIVEKSGGTISVRNQSAMVVLEVRLPLPQPSASDFRFNTSSPAFRDGPRREDSRLETPSPAVEAVPAERQ